MTGYDLKKLTFTGSAGIRPTVYVALGGSGKATLLQLRRLLYTRYRMAELPCQRFIIADTDWREEVGSDVLDRRVQLEPRWLINLGATPSEVEPIFENKGAYRHIHRWLSQALTNDYSCLVDGAGQNRSYGKLAFWMRYNTFMSHIKDAYHEVTSGATKALMLKLFPYFTGIDAAAEIVLIGGLAGGTGSGSFLDAAMAIKHHSDLRNASVTGILYMSDVFRHVRNMNPEFMRRNTYGALTELDGMMAGSLPDRYMKTAFDWEGKGTPVSKARKPFDAIYLIGAANRSGHLYEKDDVYEGVAEKLALEFDASTFGGHLRSFRSNERKLTAGSRTVWTSAESANTDRLLFSDSYESAYSSFGIASIVYDRFKMRNVAATHWLSRVFRYLLGDDMPGDDVPLQAGAALGRLGIAGDAAWARLVSSSSGRLDEAWAVKLRQAATTARNQLTGSIDLERDPRGQDAARKGNALLHDLHTRFVINVDQPGGPLLQGAAPGPDCDVIERNLGEWSRRLKEMLDVEMAGLLQRPEQAGIPAARDFLNRAAAELQRLAHEVAAVETPRPRVVPQIDVNTKDDDDVRNARELLDNAQRIPAVFVPFRQWSEAQAREALGSAQAATGAKLRRAIESSFDAACRELEQQVAQTYRTAAARNFGSVLRDLMAHVGTTVHTIGAAGTNVDSHTGLRSRLQQYQEGLLTKAREAEELNSAFRRRREEYRNLTLSDTIDQHAESADYLSRVLNITSAGAQRDRRIIGELFDRFLRSQAAGARADDQNARDRQLAGFVDAACNHRGNNKVWASVCENLEASLHELFVTYLEDRQIDAALARSADDQRLVGASRVDMRAEAFVRLRGSIEQFEVKGADTYLYGVNDGGGSTAAMLCQRSTHATEWQKVDLRSGTISFYNEINGFPLLALETIWSTEREFVSGLMDDPREAERRFTHRDWWMFRPIMPPKDDREVALNMQLNKRFWLGVMLGAVELEANDGERFRIVLHPDSRNGWQDAIPLGSAVDHAIIRLRKSTAHQDALMNATDAKLHSLDADGFERLLAATDLNERKVFQAYSITDDFGEAQVGGTGFRNLVFKRILEDVAQQAAERGVVADAGALRHARQNSLPRVRYRDYDTMDDVFLATGR